jgi:hypothetical protein
LIEIGDRPTKGDVMGRLFGEVWKEWGVDEESTYQRQAATWMMVPLDAVNLVLLKDNEMTYDYDHARLEVREVKDQGAKGLPGDWQSRLVTPAAKVADGLTDALAIAGKQSARLLAVRGKGKRGGEAKIEAKSGQTIKETLAVSVHPRVTLKLSFHFVKLKGGGADGKGKSLSGWNTSHVTRWIDGLNQVFSPQANIGFKQHAVQEPPVDRYSGATAQYKTGEEWNTEVGHVRDGTAAANVFLVGNWRGIGEDHYKDVLGSYIIATRDIVCDDQSSHDAFMTTLAHECGHFLGHRTGNKFGHPDSDKKHWLMTTIDWKKVGVKVPRQYVLYFNPW